MAHYTVQHSTTRLYTGSANVIQVNQYISHTGYNSSNLYINDIGLMRVRQINTLKNINMQYIFRLPVVS